MDLYIANGTKQHQSFQYRIPGTKQVRTQHIAIGNYIRVAGDLSDLEIKSVVAQHRKYGLIDADDINKGRGPAPLCFRVGGRVTPDEIVALVARNRGELIILGKKVREEAATALGSLLGKAAEESGTGADFSEADIDIIEEENKAAPKSDEDMFDEKMIIQRADNKDKVQGKNTSSKKKTNKKGR